MTSGLEQFLDEEELKLELADELQAKLDSYRFGRFDPRYWSTSKKLSRVVDSFKLCDKDYRINLPELD